MSMVFCRGCGKELHETAPTCPHCGFVQAVEETVAKGSSWMAITAFVMAILCFLNWFNLPDWDSDMEVGLWMFTIVSVVLGSISLKQQRKQKVLSIISVVVAGLTMLILIGRI